MNTPLPRELESLLRADGDGPAVRIDKRAADVLIEGALDHFEAEAGVAQVDPQGSKPPRKLPLWWMLAAALVLTGSAAAMVLLPEARTAQTGQDVGQESGAAESKRAGAGTDVVQDVKAQDLLRVANRLRGGGQYRAAERTYLQAVAQSPHGAPGYAARVAAADLRAERLDDAQGALQLYREALRSDPQGALTPEIHEGMANVYRKLGSKADERRALKALLNEQPQGPAAERARERLRP